MKKFTYTSASGGTIAAYRWEPEGTPVAIVQLVHGIAEYALRYDAFARWLTAQGILVVAEDHPGHGASACGAPLYFPGGWDTALEDVLCLSAMMRREFPQTPFFILGHSMGSFLVRNLLFRRDMPMPSGAILCGTGWQPGWLLRLGALIARLECRRLGGTQHSPLLHRMMFGSYNRPFRPNRTPNDWLNTDPVAVDAYTADPLCGGAESCGLAAAMLHGLRAIESPANLRAMPHDLPILLIAGRDDPVGNMGRGVERTARAFREAGMQQVTLRLFDGRHEILNEPNHAEVYETVLEFVTKYHNFVTSL